MAESKNLLPDIMRLLGLETGERFHVVINGWENRLATFYFTDDDLKYTIPDDEEPRQASDSTVIGLIFGGYVVKKIPWVPKVGETYWCVMPASDPDYPKTMLVTNTKNSIFHLFNLLHHNYFRSQGEAEEHKKDFVKELQEKIKEMY